MASEPVQIEGPKEGADPRPSAGRARLLIVDDERGPRESLRMILSSQYEIRCAENGVDALATMRGEPIDLVTADLNMPGMRGDALMRTIRAEFPQTEIIIITGCGSIESAVEGIRHGVFDYLTKPFDVVQVLASVERGLTRRRNRQRMQSVLDGIGRLVDPERDPRIALAELEASPCAGEHLRAALDAPIPDDVEHDAPSGEPRTIEFLQLLAETIESRDLHMRGHARRVAFYADLLAACLCLPRDARKQIRMAAFLHDIGKVGARSDVLSGVAIEEPQRRQSIERHPKTGEKLLIPLGLDAPITAAVRHHHERYDGAGYPDGRAGEAIPLASRIVAIADAFDAMTCERPYRAARTRDEAIRELRDEAGRQFDPNLVGIFCELVESGATHAVAEAGSLVDEETHDVAANEAFDGAREPKSEREIENAKGAA